MGKGGPMGLGGHGDDDTEKSCVVGVFIKSRTKVPEIDSPLGVWSVHASHYAVII